eukprot:15473498-Alexandrium_andersonii.AAC.1
MFRSTPNWYDLADFLACTDGPPTPPEGRAPYLLPDFRAPPERQHQKDNSTLSARCRMFRL